MYPITVETLPKAPCEECASFGIVCSACGRFGVGVTGTRPVKVGDTVTLPCPNCIDGEIFNREWTGQIEDHADCGGSGRVVGKLTGIEVVGGIGASNMTTRPNKWELTADWKAADNDR